jgi:23S rRNA pseudouridine1911/1915/1917 synthase
MKIEILYKNEHIVVCLKPVGVDSEGEGMPRLLKEQLGGEIYPVHRLDKAVGGLMVFARTKLAAGKLSAAVADRELEKEYYAVVSGKPEQPEAVLEDLLYRDAAKNKSYVVKRMRRGVKSAKLEYKLLESHKGESLLRIRLHTGRSHQIRAQFSSRGLPLLGDIKYGSKERRCSIALWSCRLAFKHPKTGKPMEFSAKPPEQFPWNDFKIE